AQARAAVLRHEGANAVEGVGGDAAAIAQAARKLAVVDRAAAECRLGETGLTAEIGDFPQDGIVHGTIPAFPRPPETAALATTLSRRTCQKRNKPSCSRQPQTVPSS